MISKRNIFLLLIWGFVQVSLLQAAEGTNAAVSSVPNGMALIPSGIYHPIFRKAKESNEIAVSSYYLDRFPVTNAEFLEFVRANPKWRRSQVKRILADENYLKTWADDIELGSNADARSPVTHVSWYAARAYSVWKARRLPTTAEWEYAASASSTNPDGENDPEFKRQILAWYSTPSPERVPEVGTAPPNFYGVHDLHGLVWEWVADFDRSMAGADSELGGDAVCGSGAEGARNRDDYPAFMRQGFRSGLKPNYAVHNLGFRCAKSL